MNKRMKIENPGVGQPLLSLAKKEVLIFFIIFLFYLGNTLFDQKSLALMVPVANRGDRRQTTNKEKDIAAYRLNWPTGLGADSVKRVRF